MPRESLLLIPNTAPKGLTTLSHLLKGESERILIQKVGGYFTSDLKWLPEWFPFSGDRDDACPKCVDPICKHDHFRSPIFPPKNEAQIALSRWCFQEKKRFPFRIILEPRSYVILIDFEVVQIFIVQSINVRTRERAKSE